MNDPVKVLIINYVIDKLYKEENKIVLAIARDQYREDPQFTQVQLAAETKGAIKHYLRGKIGPLIDVIWLDTDLQREAQKAADNAAAMVFKK